MSPNTKRPDWLKGVFPALVTPFTDSGSIDEEAFRLLIKQLLPHVDGMVPCGTTGEFSMLTREEKERVIEICLDEVNGQVPVLPGTGCPSTRETVDLTRWARDAGATGALVVAPYFLKPSFNEIYDHFEAVDAVGLPLVIYHIPQCTGSHFRWWTAEGMALGLDHVVGVKDTSGDMPFFMALMEKIGGAVRVFCGHDEIAGAALLVGADGLILASANIIPDIWKEIYEAAQAGELSKVQQRHRDIQILARLVVRKGGPQAIKEALRLMGLNMGNCRLPFIRGGEFEREDEEDMRTQLEKLGKAPVVPVSAGKLHVPYSGPPDAPPNLKDLTLCVGEGFSGPPLTELAHIDLVLGWQTGPVGRAVSRALEEPRKGHELKLIMERPRVLFVPTVTVRGDRARRLVYVEAVSGVKMALEHAIQQGQLPEPLLDELCMIANVFVHPAARIPQRVRLNNYKAMRGAIRKAIERRPSAVELIAERASARHPFRYAP
jgi:4-hydroxy-tetrahydrodipicolinate synthase